MSKPTIRSRRTRSSSVGGPSAIRSFNEQDMRRLDHFMGCFDRAGQDDVKAYIDKLYLDMDPQRTSQNSLPTPSIDRQENKAKPLIATSAGTPPNAMYSKITTIRVETVKIAENNTVDVEAVDEAISVDEISSPLLPEADRPLPQMLLTPESKRKIAQVSPEIQQGELDNREPIRLGRRLNLDTVFKHGQTPSKKTKIKSVGSQGLIAIPSADLQTHTPAPCSPRTGATDHAAATVVPAGNAAATALSSAPPRHYQRQSTNRGHRPDSYGRRQ